MEEKMIKQIQFIACDNMAYIVFAAPGTYSLRNIKSTACIIHGAQRYRMVHIVCGA